MPALVFVLCAALVEGVESSVAAFLLRAGAALLLLRELRAPTAALPRRALPFLLAAAAAVALCALSASWAAARWVALQWSLNLAAPLFLLLSALSAFRRGAWPPLAFPAALLCASAVELPVQAVQLLSGSPRPAGTLFNPNWLAALHGASLLCLAAFLLSPVPEGEEGEAVRRRRPAAAAAALLLLGALAATGSRGAFLALGAGGAALLASLPSRRKALLGGAAAALVLAAAVALSPAGKRFLGGGDPYAWSRVRIWGAAVSMARENPAGVGAGNFRFHFPRHGRPEPGGVGRYTKTAGNAHGEPFQALADLGLPGLLLYLAAAATLLAAALRRLRDPASPWAAKGAAAVAVSLGAHTLVDAALHPLALSLPLALAAALVLSGAGGAASPRGGAGGEAPGHGEGEGGAGPAVRLAGAALPARVLLLLFLALSLSAFAGRLAELGGLAAERRGAAEGAPGGGLPWFRAAAYLDPLQPDHPFNLSGALFGAARRGGGTPLLRESLAEMERAGAMNPAELRYRLRKIQILRALGGEEASPPRLSREYASALAWHPRNAFLLAEAARVREASGDGGGAAALLERAAAAEPNFAWAKEELARLLTPSDRPRAADLAAEGAATRARLAGARGLTPAEEKLVTFPEGRRGEPEGRGDPSRPGEP